MALVRDSFVYNLSDAEKEAYKEKIKDQNTLMFDEPFLVTKEEAEAERRKRAEATEE